MSVAPARPIRIGGRVRAAWKAQSRQERLVYQLLLPVFGTLVVATTVPFILAVYQALTNSSGAFVGLTAQCGSTVAPDGITVTVNEKPKGKSGVVHEDGSYHFFFKKSEPGRPSPEKPHIHVGPPYNDGAAKFWLRPTIQPAKKGPYTPNELVKIRRIIKRNLDKLIREWNNAC